MFRTILYLIGRVTIFISETVIKVISKNNIRDRVQKIDKYFATFHLNYPKQKEFLKEILQATFNEKDSLYIIENKTVSAMEFEVERKINLLYKNLDNISKWLLTNTAKDHVLVAKH